MNDFELLQLQTAALYRFDARGRMRANKEPGDPPAPRFFFGRSTQGNLWRARYDLPDTLVGELGRLVEAEAPTVDLQRLPTNIDAIRSLLEQHAPINSVYAGPAYTFPATIEHVPHSLLVDQQTVEYIRLFWGDAPFDPAQFVVEYGPIVIALDEGAPAALCFCSRQTSHAAEAGLETLPVFRRRGHATAAVAAWALAVRASGRIPLYSTSWDNLASQGVARRLHLRQYAVDLSIG